MKPVIAVDIDEVLVPYAAGFIEYYNEIHSSNYALEDLFIYRFEEVTNDSREYMVGLIHAYHAEAKRGSEIPIEGAVKAISKLAESFKVDIVTARRYTELEITERWLRLHFPQTFRSVHFIRGPEDGFKKVSKIDTCLKIKADVLIDDRPDYVIEAASVGIKGLLFGDYPWNRSVELPAGVVRVRDWEAVLEELM